MKEKRLTYITYIACIALAVFFANPVKAFVGQGEQSAAGQELHPDCVANGGKCLPSSGAGSCPAGTVALALDNPNAQYNCENNYACCKGTPTAGSTSCPAGQAHTKPGLGAVRCGSDQCRIEGYLYFTDCMNEADCAANRGTNDGGNIAGCTGEGISCCRIKKNRCNDSSKDPNKIFLCTTPSECTAKNGVPFAGGPSGCGGGYSTCCEFRDDLNTPMLNAGVPLVGYGVGGPAGGATAGVSRTARKYQNINSFCFTEVECANASGAGAFKKGGNCPNKGNTPQGYCVAPKPEYELQYPLGGVKTIDGLKNFISLIFNYGMGIIIIVAAVLFTYGGLRYMVAAVSNDVEIGKSIMIDSVMGLLMGLGAYAILANVNFNTVNLRDFDVFMINRLSFFDNLYCDAVIPAPGKSIVMFQDAGTPFAPKELDITKGYALTLKDTECGKEYFIEGADSLSVCSGTGCGGKGACLNCSSGASNCKSSSEKEHVCFDANIAGTVLIPNNHRVTVDVGNRKLQAYMFCDKQSAGIDFTKIGGDTTVKDKVTSSVGILSGSITTYAIKLSGGDLDKVKSYKNNCTGKSGLVLEHHLQLGLTGNAYFYASTLGESGWWYYYLTKSCSFDFDKTEMFRTGKYTNIDSAYKAMKVDKRQAILDNAWTLDDILTTDDRPIMCNVTLDIPDVTQVENEANRHN